MKEPLMTPVKAVRSEDLVLDLALQHEPKPSDLASHAARWASWQGHDEQTAEAYGEWYAEKHEGCPWSGATPHKTGFKRFAEDLEDAMRHSMHPSRYIERTLV